MGMGIVSDSDFDSELANVRGRIREESNSVTATINPLPTPGRNNGDINVPDSLRKVIGDTAVSDGRQEALAIGRAFGISDSSVSAYGVGARSTASYNDRPALPVINGAKEKIQRRARIKLHTALSALTKDKIQESKAIEIASIAKTMSAIIRDMEPETPKSDTNGNQTGPTFVFMAPPILKEDVFETKYVRE
jgi:hypothetical protein